MCHSEAPEQSNKVSNYVEIFASMFDHTEHIAALCLSVLSAAGTVFVQLQLFAAAPTFSPAGMTLPSRL